MEWGVTQSIIDLNASPKSNALEIKCSALEIKHPNLTLQIRELKPRKEADYSIIKSIMDFEYLPKSNTSEIKWRTPEKMSKTEHLQMRKLASEKKWITQSHPGCEWQSRGQTSSLPAFIKARYVWRMLQRPWSPWRWGPTTWHIGSIQINLWWSFVPRWFRNFVCLHWGA